MKEPRHVLVFRFSALGDVAMTVPVIKLVLQQHQHLQITFVSTAFVQPLFKDIERLNFYVAELKGMHKGLKGLYRLHNELNRQFSFDSIADLHDVLRTKVLRTFFSLSQKKIAVIHKGRREKKELTRIKNKKLHPLKSTFERYADVFKKLDLPIHLNASLIVKEAHFLPQFILLKNEGYRLIGVAPFAKHAEKMYPLEKMKEVLLLLNKEEKAKIFLFGGREEESILDDWASGFQNVESLAGKMSFTDELYHIAQLDVMISMDSANMHLASLFGIPVVSVWGSTHLSAGFYGWQQSPGNAVQVDLYCRPCSVFGNRKCYRGDLACLHSIAPQTIVKKVVEKLTVADG